jgi:hypothetical protein
MVTGSQAASVTGSHVTGDMSESAVPPMLTPDLRVENDVETAQLGVVLAVVVPLLFPPLHWLL